MDSLTASLCSPMRYKDVVVLLLYSQCLYGYIFLLILFVLPLYSLLNSTVNCSSKNTHKFSVYTKHMTNINCNKILLRRRNRPQTEICITFLLQLLTYFEHRKCINFCLFRHTITLIDLFHDFWEFSCTDSIRI